MSRTGSSRVGWNEPPPEHRFKRRLGVIRGVVELWKAREMIRTVAERALRARYKQTLLGFGWAIITPLTLMIVFSVFLTRVATINTHGAPYPLFSFLGLVPWTFFVTSVNHAGQSIVSNKTLLTKVYCPREVFPIGSVIVAATDALFAGVVLVLIFVVTGFAPKATSVWVPMLALVQLAFTLGIALLVSAILVYLRDLQYAIPIALQLGLFATPVAWGIEAIPESVRTLYAIANPLGPVIDGYRRTVLAGMGPDWGVVGPAAATSVTLLVVGYALFKRLETHFADVA